jgi:2'-5' RNA ligase
MQPLYFIAIVPDASRQEQVTRLKQYMAEHYRAAHALKTPPHITIVPPFRYNKDQEAQLIASLDTFAASWRPFSINIDGFGNFPPRVIFLNVQPSDALNLLHQSLQERITARTGIRREDTARPFRPHMTIAFRDLKKSAFYRAVRDLGRAEFGFEFFVDSIHLLRHDGERWSVVHTSPMYGDR